MVVLLLLESSTASTAVASEDSLTALVSAPRLKRSNSLRMTQGMAKKKCLNFGGLRGVSTGVAVGDLTSFKR